MKPRTSRVAPPAPSQSRNSVQIRATDTATTRQQPPGLSFLVSEEELQTAIVTLARLRGWRVHHTRPAMISKGWRTPIQGDPGFFDLVMARADEFPIFAELKSEKGKPSENQLEWARAMSGRVYLWRPSDWISGAIEKVLTKQP